VAFLCQSPFLLPFKGLWGRTFLKLACPIHTQSVALADPSSNGTRLAAFAVGELKKQVP
jgi:hypothetical protein